MTPNVCRKTSEDQFLDVPPKNGQQKLHDNFLGKFGKIWAKIFCTPKTLLAPTPMFTPNIRIQRVATYCILCSLVTGSDIIRFFLYQVFFLVFRLKSRNLMQIVLC